MATDYTWLLTTTAAFINKSDLYAAIPGWIALTEAQLNRRLRLRRSVVRAQATIASEFETLPTDFAAPISLTLSDGTILDCVAPDAMAYSKSLESDKSGKPSAYAVVGGSFEFDQVPDQSYTAVLIYYGQLTALSTSNLSNWLMAAAPDIYLYGVLCQAAPYLGDDARLPVWQSKFETGLAELALADQAESFGARLTPSSSYVV